MLPKYLSSITSFVKKNKRKDSLHVVHMIKDCNYELAELNLFNELSPEMIALAQSMPLRQLAQAVHDSFKEDKSRGNKFIDVGFSSDINTKRDKEFGGVSRPQRLDRSSEPMFEAAMVAMTNMCDLVCQPNVKGKVFRDEVRNRLFAGKHTRGNRIEALRVALTNGKHIVACHVDDKNDVLEYFRGVINYSEWFMIEGEWWRLSIIGYSRKSIAGSLRRTDLYQPLVERVATYYQAMTPARKDITSALLDFSGIPRTQVAKRLKPHANKCVYYSIYVHCLTHLTTKLGLSQWHVLAMLTNTIVSESPDFFYMATAKILKSCKSSVAQKKRYCSLGPIDFAYEFYTIVFDDKLTRTTVPGQRHQPHYNRRQKKMVINQSVKNVYRLYRAFLHLDDRLASDPHYYGKAVAFMEHGYLSTGVYGAGGLTGQHLIHIGVLCGLFPCGMLSHAEIGEATNSYKYLQRWEGLSDHLEDTRQLLACLGTKLDLPHFICENVVCKFGQDQTVQPPKPKGVPKPKKACKAKRKVKVPLPKGKKSRKDRSNNECAWKPKKNPYRDSIYRKQGLYYLNGDQKLVKVTALGSRVILPIASRCSALLPQFESEVEPTDDVGYDYWRKRTPGRRVVQMKTGTRSHLTQLLASREDGNTLASKVALPSPTARKRSLPTIAPIPAVLDEPISEKKPKRTKIQSIATEIAIIEAGEAVTKNSLGLGSKIRKSLSRKCRVPVVQASDEDQDHYVPTEPADVSDSIDEMVTDSVRLLKIAFDTAPVPLSIEFIAAKALGVPRFEKSLIQFESIGYLGKGARTVRMVSATFRLPSSTPTRSSIWFPPSEIGSSLVDSLFPESIVKDNGRRYHKSNYLAKRYLCMAAILLEGNSLRIHDLLPSRRTPPDVGEILAFVDRILPTEYPMAALEPVNGSWAFSFVSADGLNVGQSLIIKRE